jgi:hypothetical protein
MALRELSLVVSERPSAIGRVAQAKLARRQNVSHGRWIRVEPQAANPQMGSVRASLQTPRFLEGEMPVSHLIQGVSTQSRNS